MSMAFIPVILILGVIVLAVVIAVQRSGRRSSSEGDGADLIAYLVLALSMGVAGFALAELASTAFPGETFVFDPASDLATSLAALVVSAPFLVYFWVRQSRRRAIYPRSTGWALYLSLIELVFLTAFVVSTVEFLNGLFTDASASSWTGVLIFGGIVGFHEYSARVAPPQTDAAELRRVIGSAIGLIPAVIGATAVLTALLGGVFESMGGVSAFDRGFHPWVSMLIVGAPIWWYRWWRPWDTDPGLARLVWTVAVTVASLATALGAATAIAVQVVEFLIGETAPAGRHFDTLPLTLSLVLVGLTVWYLHRRLLHEEAGNALRVYQYALAALGLVTAVSMATALAITTFDRSLIVGAGPADVVSLAVVLIAGLVVWLVFERIEAREGAIPSWPRKLYTLGLGIVFGLVAAGGLIASLFVLLRRLLDGTDASLLEPGAVFVFSGLAAWYLLHGYFHDRGAAPERRAVAPFDVTIICSHPGSVSTLFPEEARVRVWYRADGAGVVTDEMATGIVAAVANRSSFVWVDEEGFRVAPRRSS